MIANNPYGFRSSDVIFTVWADRRDIPAADRRQAWAEFDEGSAVPARQRPRQAIRLGIHADDDGRLAVYAVGSDEYEAFAAGRSPLDGKEVTVRAVFRSKR